ncbi:MAG TPA: hypothetical protein VNG32_00510 [Candidatus Dormibacteraeota bacterium]|nr:hypothetical protein [Candidatus Dormibacteraeota bacterium]
MRDKRTTLYILYTVIVVAVIIGIILIFRSPTANAPTSNHKPAGSATRQADTNKMVITGVTSTPGNNPVTNTTLNNTGPGDVIGLFVAVSGLGAWLWRRKQLRDVIR